MFFRLLAAGIGLALTTAFHTTAAGQATITLQDAINSALSNNPNLKQFQLRSNSANLSIDVAKTDFQVTVRPQTGVVVNEHGDSAGYYGLRVSKKNRYGGEFSVGGINDDLLGSDGSNRYTISYSQALFRNAGKLVNEEGIVQARQAHRSAMRAHHQGRARLVVSVVEAYENVLRLGQQLAADEQAQQRAASLYKLTVAKERLGRTTRIDTLRVQLQRGEAASRVNNTREQLSSARRVLGELLGLDHTALPALEPAPLFFVDVDSLQAATATAVANRLDYAEAQQGYEDALRATRISKRSMQPDLKLVARYEHADSDLFFDDDLTGARSGWHISLVSDTDLNRRRDNLEYRQSLLRQDSAMEDIRAKHLAIGREVEQALLAYHRAHEQLRVLEGNYQHAGARLKLARRLFRVGRTDGFSVTDAEQAYFTAQRQWLHGRSEASVSGYRLLHATGTLLEVPDQLKPRS